MIPSAVIAMPAASPLPNSCACENPATTCYPRPPPPTSPPMTTIDSTKSRPWLEASRIAARAIGSCTLPIICQTVVPAARAASTEVGDTPRTPSATSLVAIVAAIAYGVPIATTLVADGVRGVSPTSVEAARAAGTTVWQMIGKVQLPMARAAILLASNQGLLFVLSMVVIGGLVGGGGLGYHVVAGFSQACLLYTSPSPRDGLLS